MDDEDDPGGEEEVPRMARLTARRAGNKREQLEGRISQSPGGAQWLARVNTISGREPHQ